MTDPSPSESLAGAAGGRPEIGPEAARAIAERHYGLSARATEMPSYIDRNFLLEDDAGGRSVLKVSALGRAREAELQTRALIHLARQTPDVRLPRARLTADGEPLCRIEDEAGRACLARLLTYLPGRPMATLLEGHRQYPPELLHELGQALGWLDLALASFRSPGLDHALDRDRFKWDLCNAAEVGPRTGAIVDPERRELVEHYLLQFRAAAPRLARARPGIVHNDANIHNVLVDAEGRLSGLIDFGDLVRSRLVCDPAIAAAYAMIDQPEPLEVAARLIAGYHGALPLTEDEIGLLFPLLCARHAVSVVIAAESRHRDPDNDYIGITEEGSWRLLARLREVAPATAEAAFRAACGLELSEPLAVAEPAAADQLLASRRRHLGPSLSLSYQRPLHMVRGAGQFLFAGDGRAYLDCINNVCHVGHCHPRVVAAAHRQMGRLNTNTRYLYASLARYTERLTALFPPPLSVCFLVCSGSEANDLALRLARAHTGGHDVVVLDGAYHGHSHALIELSPYKFAGAGGTGEAAHVHTAAMPDPYRGPYKRHDPRAGERYAESVRAAVERAATGSARGLAAFFAEPLLGCGGQVEPPPGYLAAAFEHVRAAGGVCVADEVQVGFGRVGSHFWAFETQGVVPDVVTLGKPIGNGHPMAAVITTPEIAASFDNGMEYFNTFGGNPVSCEIGLAVLDVIEEEGLQAHAHHLGERILREVAALAELHPLLGDVRGRGLFLGFELVRDRDTLEPAPDEASRVIERMKEAGVLLSTDGPLHNVIKLKPPMVFDGDDATLLVSALDRVLGEV